VNLWPQGSQEAGGRDLNTLEGGGGGDHAGWDEGLAGDDKGLGEDGGAQRVSQVLFESSQGALTGHLGSHDEANEGEHSKASVLNLLNLKLLHAAGDKGSKAWVANLMGSSLVLWEQRVNISRAWVVEVLNPLELDKVSGEELESKQTGDTKWQIGLSSSLVPEDIGAGDLLDQDTGNGRHGYAAMHALGFHVPPERLWRSSETQGVEAEVTWHGASKVSRGGAAWRPHWPAGHGSLGSIGYRGNACGATGSGTSAREAGRALGCKAGAHFY
jgi:hypothetical protein